MPRPNATSGSTRTAVEFTWASVVHVFDRSDHVLDYSRPMPPDELTLRLERTEALELLAVVQATLNAIARSRDLTVGAAILAGIRAKLIETLEADS